MINTGLYVAANPLSYIDPFGLDLAPAQQNAVKDAANNWSQSQVPYVYGAERTNPGFNILGANMAGAGGLAKDSNCECQQ